MLATLLLPVLAGSPDPIPALTGPDDEAPPSVLDGWAFLDELLSRFAAEPYALAVTGAHVAEREPWVGPPLAVPGELPPTVVGARGIEVRQLHLVRVGAGADARLDVIPILALYADDELGGALVLEHLLAHLGAQSEVVTSTRPRTRPLPGGRGLLADGPVLRLDLTGRPPQRVSTAERFASLELAVRSLAAREGSRVPGLEFVPRDTRGDRAYVTLRHAAASPAPVDALQRLLGRLETVEPRLATVELDLRPPQAAEGEVAPAGLWSWDAMVEVVAPPVGRTITAPASALEAYHVLLDVLQPVRERGVELAGFVPPKRYGEAAPRSLGIGDEVLGFLASEGLGIELRRLGAERRVARGSRPEGVALRLDLAFRGPDQESAARLYETWRTVLAAQPEFESLSRVGSEPLSDGTGVLVEGLKLDLSLPGAPGVALDTTAREPTRHFRAAASHQNVQVGRIEVDARQRQITRDRTELHFTIRPFRSESEYSVLNVYNYAWMVEHDAPGYTVTALSVEPAERRGAWTFRIEVTSLGD